MTNTNGSKWIRPEKRLRIYARDWFKCQYPGCTVVLKGLSLDHINPRANGGGNDPHNLITACRIHNARRGHQFLHKVVGKVVSRQMRKQARLPLPSEEEAEERRKLMIKIWCV